MMKNNLITFVAILLPCISFCQPDYSDTISRYDAVNYDIYQEGHKLGFIKSYCHTVVVSGTSNGQPMQYQLAENCTKIDTVVSHKLGLTGINGYKIGHDEINFSVYPSKVTTVKKGGKWAVLDSNFNFISKFIFDLAIPVMYSYHDSEFEGLFFISDFAAVKKNNLWGFINGFGIYLEPQFEFEFCDNGEDPYTNIPFDAGALYLGEEIHGMKRLCFSMLKKGEKVYIDKTTLTLVKK